MWKLSKLGWLNCLELPWIVNSWSKHIDTPALSARLALGCTRRANIINMHVNLSWLKVEERLTTCWMHWAVCLNYTHAYPTRHATRSLFTVPKSRTDYGRFTVLNRAMTTWNSIPHQVTHASSTNRFFLKIEKHLMEQRGLWRDTHTGTDTCIHTQ